MCSNMLFSPSPTSSWLQGLPSSTAIEILLSFLRYKGAKAQWGWGGEVGAHVAICNIMACMDHA